MKTRITTFTILGCLLLMSFIIPGDRGDSHMLNNIVVEFVTTNGYGNNLFLDNFTIGSRYGSDLMLHSFNIPDKNYFIPGQTTTKVMPAANIINTGQNSSSGATITMIVTGTTYNVTKNIGTLNPGYTASISFDSLDFSINTARNIKVYINWGSDQNKSNDSLFRQCVFLPGVKRKVLFEAYTSTTCGPCASQNPALDAFIQARFDTVVAVKYHVWWPAPGDPMYMANINQNSVRTYLYSITAVPTLMIDGVHQQVSGYTTLSNLLNPYNRRLATGSPLSLTVTDTRLPGDTIKASVTVNVVSPLSAEGNFRLRVMAVERKITYSTPPGSNGETIFYDVFRRSYPSTYGTAIPLTPGTFNFEFKYKRESNWIDSMMYTAVFVQDEVTREVLNCSKARNYYIDKVKAPLTYREAGILKDNICLNPDAGRMETDAGYYYEGFEYGFPPPGWSMINPDDGIIFMKYTNPNGPSFIGTNAIRMRFFNYADTGQVDYLITKTYDNIDPSDSLKFDWAYAPRPGFSDRLQVKVSTNGGVTFPFTIFDRAGTVLATAPAQSTAFTPTSASQWNTYKGRIADILVGAGNTGNEIPDNFDLKQNYPNPFNPVTYIRFQVPKSSDITISVYDISGKEIATLVNGRYEPGEFEVLFDAGGFSSGIYFYRMSAGEFTFVKKMVLIK